MLHGNLQVALVLAHCGLFLAGCSGGSPAATGRAVVYAAEDEAAPQRDELTCAVAQRVELEGRATSAPPALTRSRAGLGVAWVVRPAGARAGRRLRTQRLSSHLETLEPPYDLELDGQQPVALRLADCGDRLLIAWQQLEQVGSSIRLAALGSPPAAEQVRIETVATASVDPALSCAGAEAVLAFAMTTAGVTDVYVSRLGRDLTHSAPQRLSGETERASAPAIGCAGDQCLVAWSDRRHVYSEVYATLVERERDAQGSPFRVSEHDQTESGAGGAYDPTVAALAPGRFLVAWHDNRSHDESEIYASTVTGTGRAGAERRVSRSPAPSTAADVASCDDGQGAVVWRDRRAGPPAVLFAALDGSGRRRSAALTLSGETDESSEPAMICAADGTYAVAWTEARNVERGGQSVLQLALVHCR